MTCVIPDKEQKYHLFSLNKDLVPYMCGLVVSEQQLISNNQEAEK